MYTILLAAHSILLPIQNLEVQLNNQATGMNFTPHVFLNGLTCHDLPHDDEWTKEYQCDKDCKQIIHLLSHPQLIDHNSLKKIHYIYRQPMRHMHITYKNDRLRISQAITGTIKTLSLVIVPQGIRKHIFQAFHSNPLGGHYSLYYTLHRVKLRYHWPNMFTYIKANIEQCAACVLRDNRTRTSTELVYNFPLDAPMGTIHCDLWCPGKFTSYEGYTALMIAVCHMTGFVMMEPVKEQNSTSFAKAVYNIMMRFGLAHLIITDPDSKFKSQFKHMCKLLKIGIPHQ